MKTYAKTNHTVKGICQIGPATQAAIELARNALPQGARLSMQLKPVLHHVAVSAAAWEVVVLNLINNAADALEGASGAIDVSLKTHETPESTPQKGPVGGTPWVVLQVRDTGKGIAEADLRRIFEPFFTTKGLSRGTGLGLPESLGIVEAAGGRIDVNTEPGKGTCIEVWLPAMQAE
jgi:signal transduction histidine kinase